ncbi:MAG: DUF58 domain-containing protein [Alphaproteobacteria bacterium]
MRAQRTHDPAALTLGELIAAQGRRHRGSLAPGQRFPTGMRPSRRRAQGIDLDTIGPYVVGDDLRFMDWRATARTGRAQMKRFVAESHVAQILVVDFRAHMAFATAEHPMAKTAALVAAKLAWEAFDLHEPVGLAIVPEAEWTAPRRGRGQVVHLLDQLVDSYAAIDGDADDWNADALVTAVDQAAATLRHGDQITIVSDFGGPLEPLLALARRLAGTRVLHAVIVEDAIYHHPVSAGRFPLRVAHDDARACAVVERHAAARHGEMVEGLRAKLRRTLRQVGIRIVEVTGASLLTEGRR